MPDQEIICAECYESFLFTVKDQDFYQRQGWDNAPKRCKQCREKRKRRMEEKRKKHQ